MYHMNKKQKQKTNAMRWLSFHVLTWIFFCSTERHIPFNFSTSAYDYICRLKWTNSITNPIQPRRHRRHWRPLRMTPIIRHRQHPTYTISINQYIRQTQTICANLSFQYEYKCMWAI